MEKSIEIDVNSFHKIEWCLKKDDVTPQDIFDYHQETNEKGPQLRSEIAKYCIQDCELCINLLNLLDIVPNNIGMANVCKVPLSYIFLRGQGVKVTSIVSYYSDIRKFRIPNLYIYKTKPYYIQERNLMENKQNANNHVTIWNMDTTNDNTIISVNDIKPPKNI